MILENGIAKKLPDSNFIKKNGHAICMKKNNNYFCTRL